ncbi:hypothetical protein KCMC57_up06400 [Kitasatospora sp. CMC57]|uniref:DUF4184 family protein n=1 Tax=Kitasatospora sp. CMC57 TaxID=3231513 RepID=A0AB33JN75_9ACTN
MAVPFTFSHPAAVLPLLSQGRGRGRLIASGLVAGSLTPDLPYFLASLAPGLYRFGEQTHSWWGVPTLDVLLAALLVLLWHGLLRAPLVALLPVRWAWAADRLTAARRPRAELPSQIGWLLLSGAIGAATHVGWDAFTHHDRAGVRLLPFLADRHLGGQPLFTVLQYGSSAVALAVLGWYVVRELRLIDAERVAPLPAPAYSRATRLAVFGVVTAGAVVGAALRIDRWTDAYPGSSGWDLIPTTAFGVVAGVGAALVAHALVARAVAARVRTW